MSTPECPFNHELLAAYASGNADNRERVIVEQHLAQCPLCRAEVVELEKTWWVLNTWTDEVNTLTPPLNDLRRRLAALPPQRSPWYQFWLDLPTLFTPHRWVPVTVLSGLLLAVFLLPVMQSYLYKSNTNSEAAFQAKNTANKSVTEPEKKAAIPDPETIQEANREDRFAKALAQSEQDSKNLETMVYYGKGGTLHLANMGFAPNSNIIPAHDSDVETTLIPATFMGVAPIDRK